MPNIMLTTDELTTISNAIDMQITSAQRAQKSGKTPQITEVYKLHEANLKELSGKIVKAANIKA